jgi:tRNA pseudouridine55 synthase
MDQIIPVYKPEGISSYDIIRQFKKKYPGEKIGHGGTLDPLAEGVLLILIGQATKRFDELRKLDKEYEMTMEFGWQTETGDREGKIISKYSNIQINKLQITKEKIKKVLDSFVGEYEQEVPLYSAAKFKGKPLYWYARRNLPVVSRVIHSRSVMSVITLPKKMVRIEDIKILGYKDIEHQLTIRVICGSGTYMRSLAVDIGKKLNIPAVMVKLIRTRIGEYTLKKERLINSNISKIII